MRGSFGGQSVPIPLRNWSRSPTAAPSQYAQRHLNQCTDLQGIHEMRLYGTPAPRSCLTWKTMRQGDWLDSELVSDAGSTQGESTRLQQKQQTLRRREVKRQRRKDKRWT